LTIKVEPPLVDPRNFDVPVWPRESFDPVAGHFMEVVNHYEVWRDAEHLYR
jgi:hypothetical protein